MLHQGITKAARYDCLKFKPSRYNDSTFMTIMFQVETSCLIVEGSSRKQIRWKQNMYFICVSLLQKKKINHLESYTLQLPRNMFLFFHYSNNWHSLSGVKDSHNNLLRNIKTLNMIRRSAKIS